MTSKWHFTLLFMTLWQVCLQDGLGFAARALAGKRQRAGLARKKGLKCSFG